MKQLLIAAACLALAGCGSPEQKPVKGETYAPGQPGGGVKGET